MCQVPGAVTTESFHQLYTVLLAIFAHIKGKPDVDWDAAAATASLRNAKSLKERHRQMCVRHGWTKKRGRGRYPGGGGGGIGGGAAGHAPKQDDRKGEEAEEEEYHEAQEEQKPAVAVAAAGLDGEY
ncbi:hypothetical protein MY1884_004046 [Beauveria asiatica]